MANPKLKFEVLEEKVTTSQQGVTFHRIERCLKFKVRFTIESDAYKFQCRAFSEVWNPNDLKWNRVHYLPHGEMKTPEGLCYLPNGTGADRKHFLADHKALADMTWKVLM